MSLRNKLKPDPNADGNHTTFLEDILGRITRYATYLFNKLNPTNFDEVKRVDLVGKAHTNKTTGQTISTPHVHEKDEVREATEEEIPKRAKTSHDES